MSTAGDLCGQNFLVAPRGGGRPPGPPMPGSATVLTGHQSQVILN